MNVTLRSRFARQTDPAFEMLDNLMLFSSTIAILWQAKTREIVYVSPNIEKLGFSRGEFCDVNSVFELLFNNEIDESVKHAVFEAKKTVHHDFIFDNGQAEPRRIHSSFAPLRGSKDYAQIYLIDTTPGSSSCGSGISLTEFVSPSSLELLARTLGARTLMTTYITDTDGHRITQRVGENAFSAIVATSAQGKELCDISDGNYRIAARDRRGVSYGFCECTGLAIACAPVMTSDIVAGYWYLGRIRTRNISGDSVARLASRLGVNRDHAINAFLALPEYSADDVHRMADTLAASAAMLSSDLQSNILMKQRREGRG